MKAFFIFVLVSMIAVTSWASLDESVVEGFRYLLAKPWGIATLGDTYFGFTIIFLWMAYKEPTLIKRILWLIAVYAFGTIAVSVFVLHELLTQKPKTMEVFLLRKGARYTPGIE